MPLRFNPSTAVLLRQYIDASTTGDEPGIPGAIVHIVDQKNTTIFSYASHEHHPETLFDVYSVTKIICTIAFMQLVDQGKLSLDDPAIIKGFLPQLAEKRVLTGNEPVRGEAKEGVLVSLEKQHTDITPRMLLNHTNGTGHSLFNARLRDFLGPHFNNVDEIVDPYKTITRSPLLWQPGTHANYGQGFDWVGILLECVTQRALSDVLHEDVFAKMGIARTRYSGGRSKAIKTRAGADYWPTSLRTPNGYADLDRTPRLRVIGDDIWPYGDYHVETGATGVLSCAADLGHLLSILLPQNDGVDPVSGARVLTPESTAEIRKCQLAEPLKDGWGNIKSTNVALFNDVDLQKPHLDPAGGFGFGCAVQGADRELEGGLKGRSKDSIYWYGAASTDYWVDVKKGIIVIVAGNFFPFGDKKWTDFVAGVEGWIYKGLVE